MNRFIPTAFVVVVAGLFSVNTSAGSPPWKLMLKEAGTAQQKQNTALALRYYERLADAGEAGDLNNNTRVYIANKLSMCYLELGKLDEAEKAVAQGAAVTVKVHPNESNSLEMVRAEILIARGQFAEAEQKMLKLLQKNPRHFGGTMRNRADLILGQSLLKQQRTADAQEALNRVLKSRDRNLKQQAENLLKTVK
jgi:TolA-binding protein